MKENELAKQADFAGHLAQDWRTAHAIWANIKDIIPSYTSLTPTDISGGMTMDGTWRDLDLSAYVPATVFLISLLVTGVSCGRWIIARFRPNGSGAADGETRYAWETLDSGSNNCTFNALAGQLACSMVDQTMEYKIEREGTVNIYLLGYWKTGL